MKLHRCKPTLKPQVKSFISLMYASSCAYNVHRKDEKPQIIDHTNSILKIGSAEGGKEKILEGASHTHIAEKGGNKVDSAKKRKEGPFCVKKTQIKHHKKSRYCRFFFFTASFFFFFFFLWKLKQGAR